LTDESAVGGENSENQVVLLREDLRIEQFESSAYGDSPIRRFVLLENIPAVARNRKQRTQDGSPNRATISFIHFGASLE